MADPAADPVAAYARKRAAIDQLAHAVSSWAVEDVEGLAVAIADGRVSMVEGRPAIGHGRNGGRTS